MMGTKTFYSHDADSTIMLKKDWAEVRNWTNELEYIEEELEHFLKIEARMLRNTRLRQDLQDLRRHNQLRLGDLYRYEGAMKIAVECDTTECDAFYLQKHEKHRNAYLNHVGQYQSLKSKILEKVLSIVSN